MWLDDYDIERAARLPITQLCHRSRRSREIECITDLALILYKLLPGDKVTIERGPAPDDPLESLYRVTRDRPPPQP